MIPHYSCLKRIMTMTDAVAIAKCASYEESRIKESLKSTLNLIDGLSFVKPGMKIAIKANLVSGMAPDRAVTTHPALLKELCRMLIDKGATVIIGDSPGGLYTEGFVEGVYKACSLLPLEKEFEGKLSLNRDFSVKETVYDEAVSLKTFSYTAWLDKADAIINFSKLKTHAMMGMSCSVKNMFGTIPGTTKPEYHMRFPNEQAFSNVMVDLNEYFKPSLYLVDAIDGMEGNGPTQGVKRHIGAVLASKRPYALDMACAYLIGMERKDVATLQAAYERGLGPKDISEVKLLGSSPIDNFVIPDFKKATIHQSITFEGGSFMNQIKSVAVKFAFASKPKVFRNECIGCKKCFETCPAKAITMTPYKKGANKIQIPVIDRRKCIKCFCCQEFCPKGAMKVKENPLGKLINMVQR